MIGIILTIFLLPGVVDAQVDCQPEILVQCINNFSDAVFDGTDLTKPAQISPPKKNELCNARATFVECVTRQNCGGMATVIGTQNQIFNATGLDFQVFCENVAMTTKGPTDGPWMTTKGFNQGCSSVAIDSCMRKLQTTFDPSSIDERSICPLVIHAVDCLNRLMSCLEGNNQDYGRAVSWIEQFDLSGLCQVIVFPVSKGAAVSCVPLVVLLGFLGAFLASW